MFCSAAFYGTKYYVYRLIVSRGGVAVRFRDVKLSLFPLGLEVRNIRDFPIKNDNLVSFAGVNVYLPPNALFMKKKAISIEIVKPVFLLNERLLKGKTNGGLGPSFLISRVSIRGGLLIFQGAGVQCQILDFNLKSGNLADELALRFDSPHLKVTLPVGGQPVTVEGNLNGEVRRLNDSWKVSEFIWRTRDINFSVNGRIMNDGSFQINASARGDAEAILRPLLGELALRGLTYGNARITKGSEPRVQVDADFTSPSCLVQENRCGNLAGRLSWNSEERYLDLEAAFDTPLARTTLRLGNRNSETRLAIQNVPALYVANILAIAADAPLAGVVTQGTLEIDREHLRGRAELDAAASRPLALPFVAKGTIDFLREKKNKRTTFSGRRLQFNGGLVSIDGTTDSLARTTSIRISAELQDLERMTAYADRYLGIDLRPWKLSGGGGNLDVDLERRSGRKQIDSCFRLNRFQANRQPIASLQGEVHVLPLRTRGSFTISAPDLGCRAEMEIADRLTTIRFQDVAGESRKILKILGLDVDLRGALTGQFTYRNGKALAKPDVSGRFTAPRLVFMGYALDQVTAGLSSNLKGIGLDGLEFRYKDGTGHGEIAIDYAGKRFDIRGRIDGIDAARLNGDFSGRVDMEIGGRGEFLKDPLELSYRLRDMHFYRDRGFSVSGKARILTDFSDFRLTTDGEVGGPSGASPFVLEIGRRGPDYSGSFHLDLKDLDLLIPWKNNVGSMRLLGQIYSGADGGLSSRGVAIFSGRTLALPNFSHSLDNFQGTVTFVNTSFSLQSLNGEMGGGRVEGNGRLVVDGGELRNVTFNLQGKDLRLYPMDRTSCLVSPDLTLRYEQKKLLLSGTLAFQSVEWQREIDEPLVFNTRSELSTAESKIQEMLRFDVVLNGDDILMNNSLGRIRGQFKLRLTGNANFPILTGTCEGSQGEIFFSDRSFNVLKAKLVFNNNLTIDPLVQIESEAFVQNYRIRFDIRGTASHAKPELVSSPPLPPQDILALVSLGEAFKRSGSTEVSSQQGSTAMITTKLTEEIRNRANKLLGINLLRIDPILSGQSSVDTSRLTIGKTISKNLVIVYSTNLSTSRQEILYLQYQLSPAISLIAMRNEEGRYSLDLRLRYRR